MNMPLPHAPLQRLDERLGAAASERLLQRVAHGPLPLVGRERVNEQAEPDAERGEQVGGDLGKHGHQSERHAPDHEVDEPRRGEHERAAHVGAAVRTFVRAHRPGHIG